MPRERPSTFNVDAAPAAKLEASGAAWTEPEVAVKSVRSSASTTNVAQATRVKTVIRNIFFVERILFLCVLKLGKKKVNDRKC
jgi:hypothetical protein